MICTLEGRRQDFSWLPPMYLRKLLEDVLNGKGVNQESGRHTMQETGHSTGEKHRQSQDEPVHLA